MGGGVIYALAYIVLQLIVVLVAMGWIMHRERP